MGRRSVSKTYETSHRSCACFARGWVTNFLPMCFATMDYDIDDLYEHRDKNVIGLLTTRAIPRQTGGMVGLYKGPAPGREAGYLGPTRGHPAKS